MFRLPLLLSLLTLYITPIQSVTPQNIFYTLVTSFPQSSTSIFRNYISNYVPNLLDAFVDQEQQLTVFVPSDEAIIRANIDITDIRLLQFIFNYHVINTTIYTSSLGNQTWVETLANDEKYVTRGGKGQLLGIRKDWHTGTVSLGYGADTFVQGRAYLDPNFSNVTASNGVIHAINTVLLPPNLLSKTLAKAQLSKLIYASLKAAKPYNLVYNLDILTNVTFFAPTNVAFDESYGKDIHKVKPEEWDEILELHIVPTQAIFSTTFKTGQSLSTLAGINLNVTVNKEGTFINDARVIQSDIITSHGVVHIIDHVFKKKD